MPNHVKNRIIILGNPEQIKEIVDRFGTFHPSVIRRAHDESIICKDTSTTEFSVGWLDEETNIFTRREKEPVMGLPEGWKYDYTEPFTQFPDFNKVIPQPENIFTGDLGREEEEKCRKEGIPTWYEWNCENWGTKWNSYSCESEGDNTFVFETAWSTVPEIITAMSEAFPDITFEFEYADEDTSSNCGSFTIKNGLITNLFQPESGSKQAYELAFKLRPHYKEDYKLEGDSYVYNEEDEEEE